MYPKITLLICVAGTFIYIFKVWAWSLVYGKLNTHREHRSMLRKALCDGFDLKIEAHNATCTSKINLTVWDIRSHHCRRKEMYLELMEKEKSHVTFIVLSYCWFSLRNIGMTSKKRLDLLWPVYFSFICKKDFNQSRIWLINAPNMSNTGILYVSGLYFIVCRQTCQVR